MKVINIYIYRYLYNKWKIYINKYIYIYIYCLLKWCNITVYNDLLENVGSVLCYIAFCGCFQSSFSSLSTCISSFLSEFLEKSVLKMCNKFAGERLCRRVISIKFLHTFIEIKLRHRCSPISLLRIFRTPFYKITSGGLLLHLK